MLLREFRKWHALAGAAGPSWSSPRSEEPSAGNLAAWLDEARILPTEGKKRMGRECEVVAEEVGCEESRRRRLSSLLSGLKAWTVQESYARGKGPELSGPPGPLPLLLPGRLAEGRCREAVGTAALIYF